MAQLHGVAMQTRAWSADEFRAFLDAGAIATGDAGAFALGRITLDELEILTIATHPDHRQRGLARACMTDLHSKARAFDATRAFLEVAEDNSPARNLYTSLGYTVIGRRKAYYDNGQDAVVMALSLRS